ncbi:MULTISPECIES: hypothetical protein [Cyanophyceae]|uniref:hypothetical protein n=1 Tax=Cyanophyceae TaxID=3028117 RepID=UPI0016828BAC|nr:MULTISPECIES: hypothetical protein [Cyanophyceae]MBD1915196.1 hypothetical protein [Phormidium sp. FACHB-77]MBD2032527.1 hypothetical protein [Phormidium sp. FACHB-322]MBD2050942.1 hypothetical protein [Leptolyngbya sp. FACHB-60]
MAETADPDGFIYCHAQRLRVLRPYKGMAIAGVTGLTEAQKAALVTLVASETSAISLTPSIAPLYYP